MVRQAFGEYHTLLEAVSKETAEAILHQQRPDVVITDFNLGDGVGTDVAKVAMSQNPQCRIIFMSGDSSVAEAATAATDLRIKAFLLKPFDLAQFKRACVAAGALAQ